MRGKALICLVIISGLLSAGCAAFVVGAGAGAVGAVWYGGKLEDTISSPLPKVHEAMVAGLGSLKVSIEENRADSLEGVIKGKLASGDKVSVSLRSLNAGATKVTIRVGIIGDKDHSYRILRAARERL